MQEGVLEADHLAQAELTGDNILIELEIESESVGGIYIHTGNKDKSKRDGILRGRILKVGPDAQKYVKEGRLIHAWQYYESRGVGGPRSAEIMRVKKTGRLVAFVPLPNVIVEINEDV